MAICYQHDHEGYYVGIGEDYGLLPNNAEYVEPELVDGYIPHWTGTEWEQVENHKGEQGWVNDEPYTIIDYGPYPDGWSTTEPIFTPSEQEKIQAALEAIRERLNDFAHTGGFSDILEAASYAEDADPVFAAEGVYAKEIRSQTWRAAYGILQDIKAGTTPWPTDMDSFLNMLPPLVWPIDPEFPVDEHEQLPVSPRTMVLNPIAAAAAIKTS